MHRIFILVFLMTAPGIGIAGNAASQPGFSKLKDALAFIDRELDRSDWIGLKEAMYPPSKGKLSENDSDTADVKFLKSVRKDARLADSYPNQEFPSAYTNYTIDESPILGSPLKGQVGISFVKVGDKWYLTEIYGTR